MAARPSMDLAAFLTPRTLLRWLYVGRLSLVSAILAGALFVWGSTTPETTLIATAMFVSAVGVTVVSFWWTHLLENEPGTNFRYLHVIVDVFLVTATVYITAESDYTFSSLYILVISEGALLLPLSGGVLVGVMASVLFFGVVWLQDGALNTELGLQMGLFAGVAVATGIVGDRLRGAGTRLGVVESELRQLRLDTSEVLDSLSTGVMTIDGSGNLAYLNQAGGRLLGVDGGSRLGEPIAEVLGEIAPSVSRLVVRSMEDRVPVLRFKTTIERDGAPVVLGVSTTVMDRGQGVEPSATAIFQDITNQERADVLDRRNQRLEAVAELSASLAHEIKNPLASIRSSVEQLGDVQLHVEDRETLHRLILNESDRLSRLLTEFLEFSALKKGASALVDVAQLARDAVALARKHPDAAPTARVVCEGMDEPVRIPGDSDLLYRAVYNLVLNALQFAGESGEVRVTLADYRGELPPEQVHVGRPIRLAVSDSGPGIKTEDASRIFDPFYTTRTGGSGLGLAVVHRAVEAHRGAVLAGSAPEGGAEFVMYLPGVDDADE
jgi:two-component system sensor histidine kinase PilS (NtrC family)